MSVLIETSLGEIVVDLFTEECPIASMNFLKLCKLKYYNFSPFHTVQQGFLAQTGDSAQHQLDGGRSVWGLLRGGGHRGLFKRELHPRLKHAKKGTLSMVASAGSGSADAMLVNGSQFFFTLSDDLSYLDGQHTVFGEVAEGLDTLDKIDAAYCDQDGRPLQDIRIKHTIILHDPFPDPDGLDKLIPLNSPEPTKDMLESGMLRDDEQVEDTDTVEQRDKRMKERETKARQLTLEMIGDLPYAEIKPPEHILFVCKLNPVTRDEDLELIFSRFGQINSCQVIRDQKTSDSLQYAFIEFEEKSACEEAYFKMQNVLIDDRRIFVDFSQSVSKLHSVWMDDRKAKMSSSSGVGGFDLKKKEKYRQEENPRVPETKYDFIHSKEPVDNRGRESHRSSSHRIEDDRKHHRDDRHSKSRRDDYDSLRDRERLYHRRRSRSPAHSSRRR